MLAEKMSYMTNYFPGLDDLQRTNQEAVQSTSFTSYEIHKTQ